MLKSALGQAVDQVRGGERIDDPDAEEQRQALDFLGNLGFDPVYGAWPLKRVIQQRLENPLAQEILAGRFAPGDTIHAGMERGELLFTATR